MKKRPTPQGKPSAQARAHFTPQPPRPNSRAAEALALLKRDHLDQREFLTTSRSWRLAAAVHELRRLGWPPMPLLPSA